MSIDQDDSMQRDLLFLEKLQEVRASLEQVERLFVEQHMKRAFEVTPEALENAKLIPDKPH